MDKIIFGDNQFFGINHMSEEKAQAQAERFGDTNAIVKVIEIAYDSGIHAFMFSTHDKVRQICDYFRANSQKFADLTLYPAVPYPHKYADAVADKGIVGALRDTIFSGSSAKEIVSNIGRGGTAIISRDMMKAMRLLIDVEMKMFRNLNVRVVFLQNIVTDLLLGLGLRKVFLEFVSYIKQRYSPAEAGFLTMNLPALVDFLLECGIDNPIVCSSVNKIGYFMNPDRISCEQTIRTKVFRPMAMSILASGAVSPREAIEYVASLKNIKSIIFGASSRAHIVETKAIIERYLA